MPSLWRKQKGNKISRLVADYQTPPKRGGGSSYVVETGFPTSLVDLFHKNKDKLRKPSSKKKQRSTKHALNKEDDHFYYHQFPPLPPSPDVPFCLDSDNNAAHVDDSDVCVEEEIVGHKINDVVELCSVYDDDEDCFDDVNAGVFVNKNVFWGFIFVGIMFVGVTLYYNRFFLGITLGALLLVLLEFVRNSVFRVFKQCESDGLCLVSKAGLVLVVALCTKRFFVGIITGTLLLVVLECFRRRIFGFFMPCDDAKSELRGEKANEGGNGKRVSGNGEVVVGRKKVNFMEGENGVVSRNVSEDEVGNESVFTSGIEEVGNNVAAEESEGNDISSKENGCLVEQEEQSEPICEIQELKRNYSVWPREQIVCDPTGYCEIQVKKGVVNTKEGECSYVVDRNGKVKKRRKFWKKLVPKHMRRKRKHKHGKELAETRTDSVQDSTTPELDEDDEIDYDEMELADVEISSTSSSSSDEEDDGRVDQYSASSHSYSSALQSDQETKGSHKMLMAKDRHLKFLTLFVIPLAGLVQGRIFAIVLTVICCVLFKML